MNKKFINILKNKCYIILFLLIIFLPLFQSYTKIFNDNLLNEKRSQPALPSYNKNESLSTFFSKYESYFNDTFGFRDYFIRLSNYIDINLFNKSPNDSVILGKDNYLYSSEELDDYNKENLLTDDKIDYIAQGLLTLQNGFKSKGIDFVFAIAPNKSTIYPEYMLEESNNPNEISNLDKLQETLKKYGVKFIDYKSLMLENKSKYDLYYKRDTHWNTIASALAAKELIDTINTNDLNYSIEINNIKEEFRQGDLDDLLGIKTPILETSCDVNITSPTDKLPKTLAYHDSFYNEVLPILDDFFIQRLDMHNFNAPLHSNIKDYGENAKIVVFEVVERYLYKLLDYEFSVFDDDYTSVKDYIHYTLPIDINNEDNKIESTNIAQYSYDDYNSYSFLCEDSNITWNIDNITTDYVLLEFNNVSKHVSVSLTYADTNGIFGEKQIANFMLQPDKTKYLIKIKEPIEISKLRLSLINKTNVNLNLKNIQIISK